MARARCCLLRLSHRARSLEASQAKASGPGIHSAASTTVRVTTRARVPRQRRQRARVTYAIAAGAADLHSWTSTLPIIRRFPSFWSRSDAPDAPCGSIWRSILEYRGSRAASTEAVNDMPLCVVRQQHGVGFTSIDEKAHVNVLCGLWSVAQRNLHPPGGRSNEQRGVVCPPSGSGSRPSRAATLTVPGRRLRDWPLEPRLSCETGASPPKRAGARCPGAAIGARGRQPRSRVRLPCRGRSRTGTPRHARARGVRPGT